MLYTSMCTRTIVRYVPYSNSNSVHRTPYTEELECRMKNEECVSHHPDRSRPDSTRVVRVRVRSDQLVISWVFERTRHAGSTTVVLVLASAIAPASRYGYFKLK